ncbi:MAG: amidohydrolase family protein [Firmicutes bacterium]|nr:amidohydrolase family protein [Bacillota bacterium]
MIIDCNSFFGFWPHRQLTSNLASVRENAASHGITNLVICSLRGIFDDFVKGNDETLKACAAHPELIPAATINPHRWLGVDEEVDRLCSKGVKVFRFFPEYQHWPYRFQPFYSILERLEKENAIAICPARVGGHQNNGVITELGELASRYDMTFIITGVYYGNLAEAIAVAKSCESILLETHLLNSPDGYEVLVSELGSHRIVYGSKSPLHPVSSSLLPLMKAGIGEEDRERILGGNIAKQLGWLT